MINEPRGWLNKAFDLIHRNRNSARLQVSGLLISTVLLLPLSLRSQEETKKVATVKQKIEQKTEQKVASPAAEKADPKAADTYSTRLFLTDADGSNPKQMTVFPEYTSQGSPEWSADGKYLCFDVWKMGGSVSTGQVAIVNADGTNPRTLSDGLMPSFSPGGKRIAFSRSGQNRGIWIMSIEGPDTELVQIDPEGWGTSWGSDGRIAYTSFGAGGGNITIVNVVEGTRDVVFDEAKTPYQQIYWNFA